MKETYLAIQVPDDQRVGAIAEEAQLRDADLDHIEAELRSRTADPARLAALALTVGRAGRWSSRDALGAARGGLIVRGHDDEAAVVELALELLAPVPPPWVERADSGYRRVDPKTGAALYVEDPLAAHWHHVKRWGPPLRPEPDAPRVEAERAAEVDRLAAAVRAGQIVCVRFHPRGLLVPRSKLQSALLERARQMPSMAWPLEALERRELLVAPDTPVFLVEAGFSRDPSLSGLVRWSDVDSVGVVERGARVYAAYERRGTGKHTTLPEHPSIPVEDLVDLMTRLLKHARA